MWCQFLWSKGLLWVQRRQHWDQNPAVGTPHLGVLSSASVMMNTVPAFSVSFMWPPNTDWLVSLFPRSPEDAASKSSSVGGFLLCDLLCSFIPDRAWSGVGREGHPYSPCCFSNSVKHIDKPKSHQALALESVASLSCGKSSEWSLQPTIGIDCGWLYQKKEIMEEYWTVLTGWLGLGWK